MSELAGPILRVLAAGLTFAAWVLLPSPGVRSAPVLDEFKVKREAVFEFARKPVVTRQGEHVTIAFETKGYCDVTVAIEEAGAVPKGVRNPRRVPDALTNSLVSGRIIRHLASGVLGPNAPDPFRRDSKAQVLVWDGKNDQGEYIEDKDACTVRVSLGLKARFERTLFWEPKKRTVPAPPFYWGKRGPTAFLVLWPSPPLMQATREGVFVYDGHSFDSLRMFDHEGNYGRTVYPFPANKIRDVRGLKWHEAPQDGRRLPLKQGAFHNTMLTSGDNTRAHSDGYFGTGATAMAVRNGRIALTMLSLNRLATDGSSGGMDLQGPATSIQVDHGPRWKRIPVVPRSAALSPDGRWLYLTRYGYSIQRGFYATFYYVPGVFRLDMEGKAEPELFVGSRNLGESGTDEGRFRTPSSVACDGQGRVYVSDHWTDRVQVFSPDGKHLKTIPVDKPAKVRVHQRTGEIYVFSWMFHSNFLEDANEKSPIAINPTLTRFGPLENPRRLASCPLPLESHSGKYNAHSARGGWEYEAELDSWTDRPTIWLVPGTPARGLTWERSGIRLYVQREGKLVLKRDFGRETRQSVGRARPPDRLRQHLYVNPKTGMLYLAELDTAMYHCWRNLIRFDPATAAWKHVQLPFYVHDLAFDIDGLVYLRWYNLIARFAPETWREVPWDYGRERDGVGLVPDSHLASALVVPGRCGFNYFGGMSISPKGHFAFSTSGNRVVSGHRGNLSSRWRAGQELKSLEGKVILDGGEPYKPTIYPGRYTGQEIHIWNAHGRLVHEDAIPGLLEADGGVAIDKDDNVYVMAAANRIIDGRRYFRSSAGSLMRFKPGKGRFLTSSPRVPVPLPQEDRPRRGHDFAGAHGLKAWAENPDWVYGGVGYLYQNTGLRCYCWKSRFALDYFARSFAPEIDHYSVAVLDSAGNLILRIGRYGNADSAGPRSRVPVGGDEVGLFYPQYLASHTDRRLFISDLGNARVVSVRLDYHATERVALKPVSDRE